MGEWRYTRISTIRDLGTTFGEISLGTHFIGSSVSLRADLDAMQKRKTSPLQGNVKKEKELDLAADVEIINLKQLGRVISR
jgi:hypothetical protein